MCRYKGTKACSQITQLKSMLLPVLCVGGEVPPSLSLAFPLNQTVTFLRCYKKLYINKFFRSPESHESQESPERQPCGVLLINPWAKDQRFNVILNYWASSRSALATGDLPQRNLNPNLTQSTKQKCPECLSNKIHSLKCWHIRSPTIWIWTEYLQFKLPARYANDFLLGSIIFGVFLHHTLLVTQESVAGSCSSGGRRNWNVRSCSSQRISNQGKCRIITVLQSLLKHSAGPALWR